MKKLASFMAAGMLLTAQAHAQYDDFSEGGNWVVVYNYKAEQCVVSLSADLGYLLLGRDNEGVHLFTFGLKSYQGDTPKMILQWGLPGMNMSLNRQLDYRGVRTDHHIYSLELSRKLIDYFWVADRLRMGKFGEDDVLDISIDFEEDMHSGFHDCIRKHQ
ncbi:MULTISPECIES: hypothetical protein [Henriciella]|uniref:Uncharacterized protein n=1 Tax=Henriciella pelagia TaxID=1977912 RepID=A0ABQ1J7B1_9PROT|nr:hypothetical protein [Henriciella pelagia]GGB61812.1 hypothetical protein GCM10011503_08030 [Henriciella pelagia]